MVYRVSGAEAFPLMKQVDLDGLASGLAAIAGAMRDTRVARAGGSLEGWIGESATAYSDAAAQVQRVSGDASATMESIRVEIATYAQEYDAAAGRIPGLQAEWDEVLNRYSKVVMLSEMTDGDGLADPLDLIRAADETDAEQRALIVRYATLTQDVEDCAANAAKRISALLNDFIPVDRVMPTGGRVDRSNLAVALFGTGGTVLSGRVLARDARYDAKEAVVLLNMDDDGEIPVENLERFYREYGDRLAKDPFFATAVAAEFGPGSVVELARFVDDIPDDSQHAEHRQAGIGVLSALGAGMMLASGSRPRNSQDDPMWEAWDASVETLSITAEEGEQTVNSWRDSYLEDIKNAGRGEFGVYRAPRDNGGRVDERRGYVFLGQIWGLAAQEHPGLTFSNEFVNGPHSVAHDLLEWDKEQGATYQRFVNAPSTNILGTSTPIPALGGLCSWDPVANMLQGLDGDPEVSRVFLASDVGHPSEHSVDSANVTHYLVGGRYEISGGASAYGDGGEQLGALIDEVTSTNDAREHPETMTVLKGYLGGVTTGLDAGHLTSAGENTFGAAHDPLRYWSGQILEEYVDDLAREAALPSGAPGGDGAVLDPRTGTYHLVLPFEIVDEMTKENGGMLTDLAFEEKSADGEFTRTDGRPLALRVLTQAAVNSMYEDGIEAGIYHEKYATHVVGQYAGLLAHLEFAEYNADIARGTAQDEQYSTVRTIISSIGSAVPGSDLITDELLDQWLSDGHRAQAAKDKENIAESIIVALTEPADGDHDAIELDIYSRASDARIRLNEQSNYPYENDDLTPMTKQEFNRALPDNERFEDADGITIRPKTSERIESHYYFRNSYWTTVGSEAQTGKPLGGYIDDAYKREQSDSDGSVTIPPAQR